MQEILFMVEEAAEGGYIARAIGQSIFTEADTMEELRSSTLEAIACHYDDEQAPQIVRLHIVREELLKA
ncbi:MAG: hypothetical protein AMXMBFR84_32590 [Candidatus Hydrogenedentota bacterium]